MKVNMLTFSERLRRKKEEGEGGVGAGRGSVARRQEVRAMSMVRGREVEEMQAQNAL